MQRAALLLRDAHKVYRQSTGALASCLRQDLTIVEQFIQGKRLECVCGCQACTRRRTSNHGLLTRHQLQAQKELAQTSKLLSLASICPVTSQTDIVCQSQACDVLVQPSHQGATTPLLADSVMRKRKKKMNKHKHRKRRKLLRHKG